MSNLSHRKALLDSFKKFLAVEIKLDVAETIRHHPHLDGEASAKAFQSLASPETVEQLIMDLAREEVEEAIERGDVPAASMIHLAGYKQNPIAEG